MAIDTVALSGAPHAGSRSGDHLEGGPDLDTAYRQFSPGLERRLVALTGDRAAAEDIVQEAFARLAAEVSAGRGPDSPGAWLHRVARNLAVTRSRRRTVADRHAGRVATSQSTDDSPESIVVAAEEARALHLALDRLAPHDRRALVLAAHGYAGPEIAALMGSSQGATRTRLHRARRRLRAELAAGGSG